MLQIGIVTDGFAHAPDTDQVWTPPHPPRHLAAAGFAPRFPMTTHETDLSTVDPEALLGPRQRDLLASGRLTWKPVTRRTIAARLEDARHVLNDSFETNPMFVPMSREEYRFRAKGLAWVVDPRISTILHEDGAPVAAAVCIPDQNPLLARIGPRPDPSAPLLWPRHRRAGDRAVLICLGTVARPQSRGVAAILMHRLPTSLRAAGYATMGSTRIRDGNAASLRQTENLGARPMHRLPLCAKDPP